MSITTYTLGVWSEPARSWVSFVVSSKRELVEALSERMAIFLPLHVRVVETSSDDDDAIEQALRIEPVPDDSEVLAFEVDEAHR